MFADPFGSFDINTATVTLIDANTTIVVSNAAMTEVSDSGTNTKTYEYAYPVPVAAPLGIWNAVVTANEGTEGLVSDNEVASISIGGMPDIVFLKSLRVIDDGTGAPTANPKAIPGATVLYTLSVTNQGNGSTDSGVQVVDPIPTNLSLCVANPCAQSADPIQFNDAPPGTITSGLGFVYASNVEFSNSAGPAFTYGYSPVPDSAGFDGAVTAVRVSPSGQFDSASGATPAGFEVLFRARVQ